MLTLRDAISQAPWAETLSRAQLEEVQRSAFERMLGAGETVCVLGAPVTHWTGVIEGLVKLSSSSPDGHTLVLLGCADGCWFGEGSLLRNAPRRYEGIALRRTRVAFVPRKVFTWLLDTSLPFNRFVADQLNDRIADFIQRIGHERHGPLERYIAYCLASLLGTGKLRRQRRIEMSQRDIGHLTGRSRQNVSHALGILEKEGLLERGYSSLTIRDVEALRAYGMPAGTLPASA